MCSDEQLRAAIDAWYARTHETPGTRMEPRRWPLAYDDIVDAVDAFCIRVPGDRGDRVSIGRIQEGRSVKWFVSLDDIELGRFVVTPEPGGGYSWHVEARALPRAPHDDLERDRHRIFVSIWDDLERHVELKAGLREPGVTLRRRREFWSEPPPSLADASESDLPMTANRRKDWVHAYELICELRRTYQHDYENLDRDDPRPSAQDCLDYLHAEMNKCPWGRNGQRTVQKIIKAGDAGLLGADQEQ